MTLTSLIIQNAEPQRLSQWFLENETILWWVASLSLALLVLGAVLLPVVIVKMPSDLLLTDRKQKERRFAKRDLKGRIAMIGRNLLGALFVLAGMAMLLTPGQGILSMVVGVALMDFPRKRVFLLRLVRKRVVLRSINGFRARFGRPPLELPDD